MGMDNNWCVGDYRTGITSWASWFRITKKKRKIRIMVVIAANITKETLRLIEDLLATDKFLKFRLQNRLELSDNTMLIRLSIINLIKNLPSNEEIKNYKAALGRPSEFDNFLKDVIEERKSEMKYPID